MLAGDKGRALAAKMPRDRVLTETDGPFAQVGGRAAWPWDADRAAEALSQIWSEPVNMVQRQLGGNLRRLTNSRAASE
ncbi:TatD family hydrolase [Oceaniradius stylonematis]|uniref:TatD family hydrolase n=1 Tax=Oceaniradius stylonematis TaxID=2184161 RepID=UPI0035CFD0F3